MTTPADILAAVGASKVVESGANLHVPKEVKNGAKARDLIHGWAKLEIPTARGPVVLKISEQRNRTTIRRNILKAIDPALNLNHARSKAVRAKLDAVISSVFTAATAAAQQKAGVHGAKVDAKVTDILHKRRERQKKEAYRAASDQVRKLLAGPLAGMDEAELVDLFRDVQVDHVMSS